VAAKLPLCLYSGLLKELAAGDTLSGFLPDNGNSTYTGASLTVANSGGPVTLKVDASSTSQTANVVVSRNATAGEATVSWMTSSQKKWELGLGAADTTDNLTLYYFDASNVRQLFATFARSTGLATFAKTSAFRAHKNGTNQAVPTGVLTKVTWGTEGFDLNGDFTNNEWTPPAGRPVLIAATVMWNASPNITLISIYKNGSDFARGMLLPGIAGQQTLTVSAIDNPSGTDVYSIYVYQQSGGNVDILGTSPHTHFEGARL
jgi:hypothetical protein